MTNTSTKVFSHLTELKNYFEKDLNLLHDLSVSAEKEEQERGYSATTTVKEGPNAPYHFIIPWPPIPRCTIPQSMILIAVADYLGYLVKTNNNNHLATEENIITFFTKSHGYNICSSIPEDQLFLLNRCARQGIMHNYLPKLDLEISYRSTNSPNKLFILNTNTSGLVLNVNELKRIVLATFKIIISDSDELLYQNMEDHYLHIESIYIAQVGKLIETVKGTNKG